LSHLVWSQKSLRVALVSGAEHELLPWAEEEDHTFVRRLLEQLLELECREVEKPPASRRSLYAALALCALLISAPWTCPNTPTCVLTQARPVWLEARRLANACPEVTKRLGKNVTWAFGDADSSDLDMGEGRLAVKGDKRRGKMNLRFAVPISDGVRLRAVTIEVDDERVCAIHCAVFGEDPQHPH
jgi:hypothetical protein